MEFLLPVSIFLLSSPGQHYDSPIVCSGFHFIIPSLIHFVHLPAFWKSSSGFFHSTDLIFYTTTSALDCSMIIVIMWVQFKFVCGHFLLAHLPSSCLALCIYSCHWKKKNKSHLLCFSTYLSEIMFLFSGNAVLRSTEGYTQLSEMFCSPCPLSNLPLFIYSFIYLEIYL